MNLSQFTFEFLNQFFIQESQGKFFHTSQKCQKDRWEICSKCEHFDEIEEGCKFCGCYLPHKTKDAFDSCPLKKWNINSEQWNDEHFNRIIEEMIQDKPELKDYLNQLYGNN